MDTADSSPPIRTSSPGWLATLAQAYRSKTSVYLVDDAQLGIDPINQTLLEMGQKANLSRREWMAVLIGLGISATGAYLMIMAILDPEPYSKIAFALGTGALLVAGGGWTSIRVLVGHKPPSIRLSPTGGFEIRFE
jgi:hypothetical protein